jgi:hypothetical protein
MQWMLKRARAKGIKEADRIVKVGGRAIRSIAHLQPPGPHAVGAKTFFCLPTLLRAAAVSSHNTALTYFSTTVTPSIPNQ